MKNATRSNLSFDGPVTGIDPVTKGTFIIEWAWFINDFWSEDFETERLQAKGSFTISGEDNPLYNIVKDTPLRLQEIMGSVNFGSEKRFIQIRKIGQFEMYKESHAIYLNQVVFEILTNLEYLEQIQEYKDSNLI